MIMMLLVILLWALVVEVLQFASVLWSDGPDAWHGPGAPTFWMKGLPKWMWILLSSVVMTLGPELLDLWTCQLGCLSGLTRKTACPPTTSTCSAERARSGVAVVTDTICMGDRALSGVAEPVESGVIARE